MKRVLPFVLCLILLCGCADDGKSQFLEFVNVVSSAENISFSAEVSAQYSDKTAQFTLGYEQTADGASISVIEPEMLRGIKANVMGKNLSLEYDGAMLDIGTLDDAELSPMSYRAGDAKRPSRDKLGRGRYACSAHNSGRRLCCDAVDRLIPHAEERRDKL